MMSSKYIISLDQGTTSSRAIIFDKNGKVVSMAQKEFQQYYPQSGWVEHDADEIWSSQLSVATEAVAKARLKADSIAAIGITNQRETTIVWDRKTGKPIHRAIVWQDRRTADYCEQLRNAGHGGVVRRKTGLLIDAYFSASKIAWILDNVKGARARAERGELAFGTVDSWLIWNLTGGTQHITDVSNASRTMLYNINKMAWDEGLLELFNIPESMMPEVKDSSEVYGETQSNILAARIPIAGIAGDQQAALFGQLCTQPGMVKNTYGTGCFMLMNIGDKPTLSKNKLVTTVAWKIGDRVNYALEGSIFIGGAVVQWLRDGLGIIKSSGDVEKLAESVPDTGGVYLVPAFAGLGAPHWDPHARGTIVGITRGTEAGHIARAAVESIAFQTVDILRAMEADSGKRITELRVDGGATANNQLLQFQSDILRAEVVRPQITETTAIGAAYLAGLAVGMWASIDEIQSQWKIDTTFKPKKSFNADDVLEDWHVAVETAKFQAKHQLNRKRKKDK